MNLGAFLDVTSCFIGWGFVWIGAGWLMEKGLRSAFEMRIWPGKVMGVIFLAVGIVWVSVRILRTWCAGSPEEQLGVLAFHLGIISATLGIWCFRGPFRYFGRHG